MNDELFTAAQAVAMLVDKVDRIRRDQRIVPRREAFGLNRVEDWSLEVENAESELSRALERWREAMRKNPAD